ncbi:hypothetical protein GQ600_27203 [Phytophthora cactorum]|nr:hypothetical protein GQ600_27203 [Phytophthora cactorum]
MWSRAGTNAQGGAGVSGRSQVAGAECVGAGASVLPSIGRVLQPDWPIVAAFARHMSATSSSSAEQPAMSTASAVPVSGAASAVSATQTESKPAATQSTDSASTTTSEYEFSSDEDDDDLEVVEVAPPKRNKKRKAATVDLSESSPVRRKTHTQTVRNQLATELREIRAIPVAGYTVAVHKELSGFVRGMFAPSDKFYNWQPRDDPMVAQLLDEMDKRMDGFKDSITQNSRRKAMDEWLQEMTASSFVPCLDLESIPPKTDLRAASVEKCHDSQDLEALVKPGTRICSKLQVDTASKKGKKRKYFQPLLDASTKYYAAVAATETRVIQAKRVSQSNNNLGCFTNWLTAPVSPARNVHNSKNCYILFAWLCRRAKNSGKRRSSKCVLDCLL